MADPLPVSKARSGSQKRRVTKRRVCYFDDHDNALFEQAYADYRRSAAAGKYGDSEGAFIRYMTIGKGARPLPKDKRRTGPRFNPDLSYELAAQLGGLMTDLMRIGNNTNQIARKLNEGREVPPDYAQAIHEEMREALQAIRRALWWAD